MPVNTGWIEVVCGCMFSGKTEELIRRLRRAQIAKQSVLIFKPRVDNRYSNSHIVSHSEQSLVSTVIDKPSEIIALSKDAQVIGIDEAQFFSPDLVGICEELAGQGKRVILAGLVLVPAAGDASLVPQRAGNLFGQLVMQPVNQIADMVHHIAAVQLFTPPIAGKQNLPQVIDDADDNIVVGERAVPKMVDRRQLVISLDDAACEFGQFFFFAKVRGHLSLCQLRVGQLASPFFGAV